MPKSYERKGCFGDYQAELAGPRECDWCADCPECSTLSPLVKIVKAQDEKTTAVKLDNGKPKLSLIHPSMMSLLLADLKHPAAIKGAMLDLAEAAHTRTEDEFDAYIEKAVESIKVYLEGGSSCLRMLAAAMEYGANKPEYGRNNWKKGMEWSRLIDAAQRHGLAMLRGEEIDQESGNHHAGHMLASIHMLIGMKHLEVGTNDLY